ncbi:MAG: glycosyltransferase [Sphingobacteriales bacterium]|nr:MAG: glycosyltransferase [Sphingobacteriales bacterium]
MYKNHSKECPFITVIVNCYNSEKYLLEALSSVVAQTFQNWELVFWDNHSTDGSAEIFKSFNDPRMRYYLAPNHTSLGEARNLAVKEATGSWVGFIDCDDIWLENKLESQQQLIKSSNNPNLGLIYSRAGILQNGKVVREYAQEYVGKNLPSGNILGDYLSSDNFIPLVSALFRREFFFEVGGIPPAYRQAEDYYLFAALAEAFDVAVVQNIECLYRIHSDNLTHSQKELNYSESLSVINEFSKSKKILPREHSAIVRRREILTVGSKYFQYSGNMISKLTKSIFSMGPLLVLRFLSNHLKQLIYSRIAKPSSLLTQRF